MAETFDYLESRDDADELIAEFGRTVSIRRDVASGPDYNPTLTPTDYATMAARVEFSWKYSQNHNVLAGDERWLIAAGPLALLGITIILPSDSVVIGGVAHQIVNPNPLQPAGTVVMFDCHTRI
jgi:hypothetical protein